MSETVKGTSKTGRIRIPARASLWYVGSSIMTKTVGLAATPLFTRLMDAEEYGRFALYSSWLGVAAGIVGAVIAGGSVYSAIEKHPESKEDILGATAAVTLLFAVLSGGILIPVTQIAGVGLRLGGVFIIQCMLDAVSCVYLVRMRHGYSYIRVFIFAVAECVISNLVSVALIYRLESAYEARVWGMLIGTAVCVVPIAFVTLGAAFTKGARKRIKEGVRCGLMHLPSSGASVLRSQAERLLTAGMLGEAALASYSVGASVGYGIYFVSGALLSALTPWSMRKMAKNATRVVGEVSDLCCDLILSGALIIGAAAPEVLAFLAPSSYRDGVYIALPIALAAVPTYLCSVMSAELEYRGERREVISVTLRSAAVGICTSAVMLRLIGISGAGIGTLVAASVQYVMLASRTRITSGARRGLLSLTGGCALGGLIVLCYSSLPLRIMLMIPPALTGTHALIKAKGYVREI